MRALGYTKGFTFGEGNYRWAPAAGGAVTLCGKGQRCKVCSHAAALRTCCRFPPLPPRPAPVAAGMPCFWGTATRACASCASCWGGRGSWMGSLQRARGTGGRWSAPRQMQRSRRQLQQQRQEGANTDGPLGCTLLLRPQAALGLPVASRAPGQPTASSALPLCKRLLTGKLSLGKLLRESPSPTNLAGTHKGAIAGRRVRNTELRNCGTQYWSWRHTGGLCTVQGGAPQALPGRACPLPPGCTQKAKNKDRLIGRMGTRGGGEVGGVPSQGQAPPG